jgi:hypothetical protein
MTINAGPWEYKDPEKVKFLETHTYDFKQTVDKPNKENNCVSHARYDDRTIAHASSTDIIINRQNFFKGWECNVGDAIFINPAGAISLASCGEGGYVGNILKDVGNIGPKKIICGKEHCHCGTDIIIPKILK